MSENDLKKRSGVIYLAVFLFAVCAVATVLMAAAKYLTDPTIAKAELAKIESGLQVVLDGVAYNNQPSADVVTLDDAVIYVAKENGVPSGYAVKMSSGGYGGALKQLSIGIGSSYGKAYIHGAGDPEKIWTSDHDAFLESMAEAASSVISYFNGNIAYVNVMKNMSVDCDCCAVAEDPCMKDIGILVSLDPIAIDQACVDLVYASADPGRKHLIERIESRNGVHTIETAASIGYGTREYELIEVK